MSDDASLFAKLRAGKVPLREILDMAKGPREDDVYASRETCTEVLRQLAGHCEHLIALSQGKTDLRAAVYDLERQFRTWKDLEGEKAQEYARYAGGIDSLRNDIGRVRNTALNAERSSSRALDILRDKFPEHFNDDEGD